MNVEIITKAIELMVLIIVALLTTYIIPFIKTKVGEEKLALIISYTKIFVEGIEQLINEKNKGNEKKDLIMPLLMHKADELHLHLTEADISLMIENAVKTMKEAMAKNTQ